MSFKDLLPQPPWQGPPIPMFLKTKQGLDPEFCQHTKEIGEKEICHDCGVLEGEIHQWGCDMEICPRCGHQLIKCSCPVVYKEWLENNSEERIPWIRLSNLCSICGRQWPRMFMVSKEEWERIVPKNLQGTLICSDCYKWLKWLKGEKLGELEWD